MGKKVISTSYSSVILKVDHQFYILNSYIEDMLYSVAVMGIQEHIREIRKIINRSAQQMEVIWA